MISRPFTVSLRQLFILTLGLFFVLSIAQPIYAQSAAPAPSNPVSGHQTVLSETDQYRMSAPVVKIGALLGMKPETAANVFTIFNIAILFGGIGYGLLKVLPKTFRNRSTAIQKHLVDARTATEEATARLSSVEDRLAKLDDQIAAMRAQAEADSARDEQRILANVEDEKNKILAAADAEIQSATILARREIQKYAAELAIEQAARKLVVTPETDRVLVESFAHKLGEGSNN